MDRVELKTKDIDMLLEWRDNHPDLVRTLPMPLKALEFVFPESGWSFKAIREKGGVTFHPALHGKPIGKMKLHIMPRGQLAMVTKENDLTNDNVMTIVTVYCSTMALMVYGNGSRVADDHHSPTPTQEATEGHRRASNTKRGKVASNGITYILRATRGGVAAIPKGSHASPSKEFSVRGHFRHYRSGKVIWVDQYQKGAGKKKGKRYRLGEHERKDVRST